MNSAKRTGESVTFSFEGREVEAHAGQSVAVALMAAGVRQFRQTPVHHRPRGPFCMMGICFECLLVIDGQANVQACMTPVRGGMEICRQGPDGAPLVETESGPA